ncbi:MAG: FMN-binding glutamate synthase family protein [Chloroflexi bacterium]|nr:FMN-binding glutamate synthase family protein [Chloroflexota bacterium]MDA1002658.1 FMN-binding glutamate synthase family protein [Chloroflexota bacterium]
MPPVWVSAVLGGLFVLVALAISDLVQTRHSIRRVYPIVGRLRYLVEKIGPELRQYIVTNDLEERPFNRSQRSWVYQTAKGVNSAVGFGTQHDVSRPGSFHFLPSPFPTLNEEAPTAGAPRVIGPRRPRPFAPRSRVNIAPMSFGALSEAAVRALALGAAEAGCYINTGEGGLSPHHLSGGGDVIFQIGPAKYGVRTPDGGLDWERLRELGNNPQVRAIEIKIGQGAKPGKGGILPAAKVTLEIAAIRGIPAGQSSNSPNRWSDFSNTDELIDFIERVKDTVPVPVGVKLVVGDGAFIDALATARADGGRGPDYVSVDGAEGGTGAAPLSLTDHMGVPLHDAIVTVDDAYRRHGVREDITVVAAGRIITGADAAYAIALGADMVGIARGFLFSIGCIQALRCHTNECPTGVATQNRWRQRGLVPTQKRTRVANYATAVREDLMVVTRAVGLLSPGELRREHVEIVIDIGKRMRVSDLYPYPPLALQVLDLDEVRAARLAG